MLTFIASLFYLWILYLYFNNFFPPRRIPLVIKSCIWFGFYLIHYLTLKYTQRFLPTFILGSILLLLLCKCLYKAKYKRLIFICLSVYISGTLIEICVLIVLQLIGNVNEGTNSLGSIISKLIMLAIVHAITIFKRQLSRNEPALFYWILLIVITLSSIWIIYTIFLFSQTTTFPFHKILSTFAILFLLLINMAIYMIYDKLSFTTDLHIQLILMRQQMTRYHEALANKWANDSLFIKERHNLRNQLIALRAYALQNQTEEIINFINSLLNENEFGLVSYSFSENTLVDSLLCSKKNLANQNKITYTINTNISACLPFSDTDLCILIGNALDNAFECCLSHKNKINFVNVTLQYKTNCLYAHFENPYYGSIKQSHNMAFYSTKSNYLRHGYGLRSIKFIVEKYNGILNISTENNIFSLKILLYAPQ